MCCCTVISTLPGGWVAGKERREEITKRVRRAAGHHVPSAYYAPQLENYLELETRFENLARLKLLAGRTQYLEGAGTLDELVWDTLDSFKLDYGT